MHVPAHPAGQRHRGWLPWVLITDVSISTTTPARRPREDATQGPVAFGQAAPGAAATARRVRCRGHLAQPRPAPGRYRSALAKHAKCRRWRRARGGLPWRPAEPGMYAGRSEVASPPRDRRGHKARAARQRRVAVPPRRASRAPPRRARRSLVLRAGGEHRPAVTPRRTCTSPAPPLDVLSSRVLSCTHLLERTGATRRHSCAPSDRHVRSLLILLTSGTVPHFLPKARTPQSARRAREGGAPAASPADANAAC